MSAPSDEDQRLPGPADGGDGPPWVSSRFTVIRQHAAGGLGQVFLARDEQLRRDVALKCMLPGHAHSPELRQRFLNEARIASQLEHPGIVPVYFIEPGNAGRQPYYVMRFVRGETLSDAIRSCHARQDPAALRDLLERLVVVCQAIAYAHRRGVIHRDLKPSNIMAAEGGETLVLDWGLAKRVESDPAEADVVALTRDALTRPGQVLGTAAYMPPEQAGGDLSAVGPAADIYSLGAVLYCILTRQAPYSGDSGIDVLMQVVEGPPAPPRAVNRKAPRALCAICNRAMARDPAARYSTADEMVADLQRWLGADRPRRARRRRLLWTALGVCIAAGCALAAALWSAESRRRSAAAAAAESRKQAEGLQQQLQSSLGELGRWRERSDGLTLRVRSLEAALEEEQGMTNGERTAAHLAELGAARLLIQANEALKPHPGTIDRQLAVHQQVDRLLKEARTKGNSPGLELDFALNEALWAEVYQDVGNAELAETLFRDAIDRQQKAVDDPQVDPNWFALGGDTRAAFANLLELTGAWDDAETQWRAALDLFDRMIATIPPANRAYADHVRVAVALHRSRLGLALGRRGRLQEGQRLCRQSVEQLQSLLGEEHTPADADASGAESLRELKETWGSWRGAARFALAHVLLLQGRDEPAEREAQAALDWLRRQGRPPDWELVPVACECRALLAELLSERNEFARAEQLIGEAVADQQAMAATFPGVPSRRADLARLLIVQGRILRRRLDEPAAEAVLRRALEAARRAADEMPLDHYRWQYFEALASHAAAQLDLGVPASSWDEARKTAEQMPAAHTVRQRLLLAQWQRHFADGETQFGLANWRGLANGGYRNAVEQLDQLRAQLPENRRLLRAAVAARLARAEMHLDAGAPDRQDVQRAANWLGEVEPLLAALREGPLADEDERLAATFAHGRAVAASVQARQLRGNARTAAGDRADASLSDALRRRRALMEAHENVPALAADAAATQFALALHRLAFDPAAGMQSLDDAEQLLAAQLKRHPASSNLQSLSAAVVTARAETLLAQGDEPAARRAALDAQQLHLRALSESRYDRRLHNRFMAQLLLLHRLLAPEKDYQAVAGAAQARARYFQGDDDQRQAAFWLADCVAWAAADPRLEAAQRRECADRYAELAVRFLKRADPRPALLNDARLAPLRDHAGFQQLLEELGRQP